MPFAALAPTSGSGADFLDVDLLGFDLDPLEPGATIRIERFETILVPEPTTGLLLLAASIAAAASRRGRPGRAADVHSRRP